MEGLSAVVLAAGEGKRMKSALPKVLHRCCGRPLIEYILESAARLTNEVVIVVGYGASLVMETLGDSWSYVSQEEQLGTGHAVMKAVPYLPAEGHLLVLCGDTPLLDSSTLEELVARGRLAAAAVATTEVPDPSGYGRIVRNPAGQIEKIVEEKDATDGEKAICEINCGTYYFDLRYLRHYLPLLTNNNAQGEYYLPDLIALLRADGLPVTAVVIADYRKGLGINDRLQLAEASRLMRREINRLLMLNGVTIEDPATTWIDSGVKIAADTLIRPNCLIERGTVVGSGCTIGPYVHLKEAVILDNVSISHAYIEKKVVDCHALPEPYRFIRPG